MATDQRQLAIDIVVPLYNEEQAVAEFHRRRRRDSTLLSTVRYVAQDMNRGRKRRHARAAARCAFLECRYCR
jgi:hypothetical protein